MYFCNTNLVIQAATNSLKESDYMKNFLLSLTLTMAVTAVWAQKTMDVTVENTVKEGRENVPVTIPLDAQLGGMKCVRVMSDGVEVPSQLDDFDRDGTMDELCFMTSLKKKEKKTFQVVFSNEVSEVKSAAPRVYAQMMLTNKKVKASNKQNLYINSLTVENGTNPYWMLHHHGPAFENELVAYRIYFDHRQTVDIYGKYRKGLELKDTQFYPDAQQKADGYGDDVLWVGETFGLGALRGWDGVKPQMLTDVAYRTLKVVAAGPLRTVVEVVDEGWKAPGCQSDDGRLTMTTRYTLYAGRRDCRVDVNFAEPVGECTFATGIINVKNSVEMSDRKGLRGCWGTDWPVSEKDSAGHKRETVGLGICIPVRNVVSELPADKDNYPFVIGNIDRSLTYYISFCSDNESFGYHSAEEWFAYMREWKKDVESPLSIKVACP